VRGSEKRGVRKWDGERESDGKWGSESESVKK